MQTEPQYIRCANKIIDQHVKIHTSEGYRCIASGGSMPDNIKEINISYQKRQNVNIDEARAQIVHLVESIIDLTNNDKNLRPFMEVFPFNNHNFIISIGYINSKNDFTLSPYIGLVFNCREKIAYFINYDKNSPFQKCYEEDYLTARKIVLGW